MELIKNVVHTFIDIQRIFASDGPELCEGSLLEYAGLL